MWLIQKFAPVSTSLEGFPPEGALLYVGHPDFFGLFDQYRRVEELETRRHENVAYYDDRIDDIRTFFKQEGFEVADVLFDYLLKLKKGSWRKNRFTPDHGHEIDQILPIMRRLQNDPNAAEWRRKIEAEYGSIEKWFCAILAHDIFEDFNIFPKEFVTELRQGIRDKHVKVSDHNDAIIQRTARSAERLTHYRKFSVEEIQKLTGEDYSHLQPEYNNPIPIPKLVPFFWGQMNVLPEENPCVQVFADWDKKKQKIQIKVTRYGASNSGTQNTPPTKKEDEKFYPDWPTYITSLAIAGHYEEDIFDVLAKLGDRNHGIATYTGVQPFSIDNFDGYLDETELLFSHNNPVRVVEAYAPDSPLLDDLKDLDKNMGVLYVLARFYQNYNPDKNLGNSKGNSVNNLMMLHEKTGINPVVPPLLPHKDRINNFYRWSDKKSNIYFLMFRDFRTARNPNFREGHADLYRLCKNAVIEVGGDQMKKSLIPYKKTENSGEQLPLFEPTSPCELA